MSLPNTTAAASSHNEFSFRYHGWRVVLAACLGVMGGFGSLFVYTFSVFVKPLGAAFGWNRESVSLGFAIAAITLGLFSPALGRLLDRFGPRHIILPCMTIFGCAVASLALLGPKIAQFYGTCFLIGLVGNGAAHLAYGRSISTWFDRRLGTALAFVMVGAGLGAMILPVVAQSIVTRLGWRAAYASLGAIALLLGLPLSWRYIVDKGPSQTRERVPVEHSGLTWQQGTRTLAFWIIVLVLFVSSISMNGAITHLSALLIWTDLDVLRGRWSGWAGDPRPRVRRHRFLLRPAGFPRSRTRRRRGRQSVLAPVSRLSLCTIVVTARKSQLLAPRQPRPPVRASNLARDCNGQGSAYRMAMRSFGIVSLAVLVLAAPRAALGQSENKDNGGQQPGFQSQVDLVSVYFTVRDGQKRLVSELPQESFHVNEDGQPQAIKFFAHHSDVVLNVGVLLDTGTRMSWILDEEGHAASMFLRHVVRPSDLAFVVSYAAAVDTLQLPTSEMALLQASVRNVQSGGGEVGPAPEGTAAPPDIGVGAGGTVGINGKPVQMNREAHLYDALRYSAEHHLAGEVGRKAIVVVALSGDGKSQSTLEEALEALLQHDVIAYVLQIYDAPHRRDGRDRCDVIHEYARDAHGEYVLRKLAEATGGRMLEVKGMDRISDALDEISEELHHQYSLGYYPENKHWDGKFRKIQIAAAGEGYKVYARRGYYAKRQEAKATAAQP